MKTPLWCNEGEITSCVLSKKKLQISDSFEEIQFSGNEIFLYIYIFHIACRKVGIDQ